MQLRPIWAISLSTVLIVACGGGNSSEPIESTLGTTAGESATVQAGQTVNAPSNVTVHDPVKNSTITFVGHQNTAHVNVGTVITVNSGAQGPSDNKITNP